MGCGASTSKTAAEDIQKETDELKCKQDDLPLCEQKQDDLRLRQELKQHGKMLKQDDLRLRQELKHLSNEETKAAASGPLPETQGNSQQVELQECTDGTCDSRTPTPPALTADDVFDAMDDDRNGVLSVSEMAPKLSKAGLTESEMDRVFELIDANQDGQVDRAEFIAFFEKYKILERSGKDAGEKLELWLKPEVSSKILQRKFSKVKECPVQCCVAPVAKMGLMEVCVRKLVYVFVCRCHMLLVLNLVSVLNLLLVLLIIILRMLLLMMIMAN